MRIHLSFLGALALCGALFACGSDDGGTSSTNKPVSCSSDAECGSGYACVMKRSTTLSRRPGARTQALDPVCFDLCTETCVMSGQAEGVCNDQCTQACDLPDGGSGGGPTGAGGSLPSTGGGPSGGGPSGSGGNADDPPETGTCEAISATGGSTGAGGANATGGAASGGSDASGGGPTSTDVTWSGTWSAELSYDARCDVVGNISVKHQTHTVTVTLDGANDALGLTTGNYEMSGFGSNSQLTLNGTFPVRTNTDKDANTLAADTKITIKLSDVSSENAASGSISGSYVSSGFSGKCTVEEGTVTFSR